jgi:ubiquinone/menaquinone biosynthesis C-methylase UbiE
MKDEERRQSFDPYRSLDQNLRIGDELNRWMLLRPRQRIVQLLKGQRVLDVCCGTGNLTAMLVAAGCQVVGIDSSPTMLSYARRKHIAAEFKQMDAAQLPFNLEFDAAVISIALHEMPQQVRENVWKSMQRAVRPRGRLIALDFAIPEQKSLLARITGDLIEQDERGTLAYHPQHYENFQVFMHNGGLISWLYKQGQPLEAEYRFWGGTLAVVVTGRLITDQDPGKIISA